MIANTKRQKALELALFLNHCRYNYLNNFKYNGINSLKCFSAHGHFEFRTVTEVEQKIRKVLRSVNGITETTCEDCGGTTRHHPGSDYSQNTWHKGSCPRLIHFGA